MMHTPATETDLGDNECIVSFAKPGADLPALHQKLLDSGIVTSLRGDRAGQNYIRLSPHFYNTDQELQRVLELL